MNPVIEEQTKKAIEETTSWYTVAIDVSLASSVCPDWGTGSILKFQERLFVLTCKHVVKEEYKSEQIKFLFRDESEQKGTYFKEDIKNASLMELTNIPKTSAVTLPIVNRFYSDDTDDLVLMEIDPAFELFREYNLYHMQLDTENLPEVDTVVCLMGFPRELIRKTSTDGRGGAFPYFLASRVVEKNVTDDKYDKDRHFLIEYEHNEKSVVINGLSGCGIWTHIFPEQQEIWTTNLRLVGVQTGIYQGSEVLKATRIERVIKRLKEAVDN